MFDQTDLNRHFFLPLKMTETPSFSSRSRTEVTSGTLGQSPEQAGIPQVHLGAEMVLVNQHPSSSHSHGHALLEHSTPLYTHY